eukprot:12345368-Heterocapsa_arctica.AAC.1
MYSSNYSTTAFVHRTRSGVSGSFRALLLHWNVDLRLDPLKDHVLIDGSSIAADTGPARWRGAARR